MRYPEFIEKDFSFPVFYRVNGLFPRPKIEKIEADLLPKLEAKFKQYPVKGKKIGIGVGSRGIRNLFLIVKTVCQCIKANGGIPYIIPAMGSHGGGTAEGQKNILASLGITEKTTGAKLLADMEVQRIGMVNGTIPVYYSLPAAEMDFCICINRIKAHTKFKGKVESGLLKMLCIGFAKHKGAITFHTQALKYGFYEILEKIGAEILARSNFKFGIGLIENAYDETMSIQLVDSEELMLKEAELLKIAKANMPALPVKSLDVLIVNEIGKNISGAGMDPNITGRAFDLMEADFSENLKATRLCVLNLSAASKGNGLGIGNADFITEKVYQALDYESTIMNVLTGISIKKGFIPIRMPNDFKAIQACYSTIGPKKPQDVESIVIKNTLDLNEYYISASLKDKLADNSRCMIGEAVNLPFDALHNLELFKD